MREIRNKRKSVFQVIIESVTHIEQLSHTWYKDFRKYVKKYFSKE